MPQKGGNKQDGNWQGKQGQEKWFWLFLSGRNNIFFAYTSEELMMKGIEEHCWSDALELARGEEIWSLNGGTGFRVNSSPM